MRDSDWNSGFGWHRHVPVAERRRQASRRAEVLAKRKGPAPAPVAVIGRKIVETFWGEAWCENLERYSDFANRLPRGRTYVRRGAVLDLQIAPGRITALVSGSRLYEIEIGVAPLPRPKWQAICRDSAGAIDSVVELLQGRLSSSVMARLCQKGTGLFPAPGEITLSCSCPDWAAMCKHVAAVLYGIGARLDQEPALLFTLRRVKEADLISRAGSAEQLIRKRGKGPGTRKVLDDPALGAIFGLDLAPARAAVRAPRQRRRPSRRT